MKTFYERVDDLCQKNNIKITNLAKQLGLSTSMPTNWKNGIMPNIDNLVKIANAFDVSVDYLLGRTDNKKFYIGEHSQCIINSKAIGVTNNSSPEQPLSARESIILEIYRELNDDLQNKMFHYATGLESCPDAFLNIMTRSERFQKDFFKLINESRMFWELSQLLLYATESEILSLQAELAKKLTEREIDVSSIYDRDKYNGII